MQTVIDSHCHLNCLDLTEFGGNLDGVLQNAIDNGVSHMLCVAIDWETLPEVLTIAAEDPTIFASVGVHPNEQGGHDPSVDDLLAMANNPNVVAIGETGLDYYRTSGEIQWQQDRFRRHIEAARIIKKPLIIHTRQAREDTIAIMREAKADEAAGVMHCFTETWEMAQQALDLNFYISFSGIVTFKNARELQDVATKVPIDRILVETDSPYLAPVPHRSKQNQPAYVKHVAEFIAELRGVSYEEIAARTSENFFRLFNA